MSVYDNETSVYGSKTDKYTLVGFPLRTTNKSQRLMNNSIIKSKHRS